MYNLRSSVSLNDSENSGEPYVKKVCIFKPQLPHLQSGQSIASSTSQNLYNPTQFDHGNNSQMAQMYNLRSQSRGPQPVPQAPVIQFPESIASTSQQNNIPLFNNQSFDVKPEIIDEERIDYTDSTNSTEKKSMIQLNMANIICPKSPVQVFNEFYKDIPIKLEEHSVTFYTASIEVNGHVYTGKDTSPGQAKKMACEKFLRSQLAIQMKNPLDAKIKNEPFDGTEVNGTASGPTFTHKPLKDFPWQHFTSLAMYNLVDKWKIGKFIKEEPNDTLDQVPKPKEFPANPRNYNPLRLLLEMVPHVIFKEQAFNSQPPLFEVTCEIDDISFRGQGSSIIDAKVECAITIIKHYWQFDFHTIPRSLIKHFD